MTTIVPTPGMVAVCPTVNVPETPAIVNCVTVSVFPSTSVSFVNTFPETGVSSGVVTLSVTAFGASLTAATVIDKVSVSIPPLPSLTV